MTRAPKRKDGQQRFEPLGSPAHVSMAALTRPDAGAQAGERKDSGVKLPQSGKGRRSKEKMMNWGAMTAPPCLSVPSGPARQLLSLALRRRACHAVCASTPSLPLIAPRVPQQAMNAP